jgi:hypothetical protein
MKALEQEVQALLHAAQQERKRALDSCRVATTFQVVDQVLLRTAAARLGGDRQAVTAVGGSLSGNRPGRPEYLHLGPPTPPPMQPDRQRARASGASQARALPS